MDGIKYENKSTGVQEKSTDDASGQIYRNDTYEIIGNVTEVGELQRHLGN